MDTILSTAYAAPIEYFKILSTAQKISIEKYEHFVKQSYRNRCTIYGANGALNLTIPIAERKDKTLTKDIRIANHTHWQKTHWKSIESAYRTSAFFEYFCDDILPIYEKKIDFLIDFNEELQQCLLNLSGIQTTYLFTDHYSPNTDTDYRNGISPKLPSKATFTEYYQVFSDKHAFIPNLSFYDLLFNVGNRSEEYLLNSVTFG